MSKNKLILIYGILIAIMPYLGFPPAWKTVFYTIIGILLIVMAFYTYTKRRNHPDPAFSRDSARDSAMFAENRSTREKV